MDQWSDAFKTQYSDTPTLQLAHASSARPAVTYYGGQKKAMEFFIPYMQRVQVLDPPRDLA
jgi:hypothetical protein